MVLALTSVRADTLTRRLDIENGMMAREKAGEGEGAIVKGEGCVSVYV